MMLMSDLRRQKHIQKLIEFIDLGIFGQFLEYITVSDVLNKSKLSTVCFADLRTPESIRSISNPKQGRHLVSIVEVGVSCW